MVSAPAETPVTNPLIIIAELLLTLQLPPGIKSPTVADAITHTADAPAIIPGSGNGFTVIVFVAVAVPQALVAE